MDEQDRPEINTEGWVDRYGDALFRFALARVNDRQVAEDLVQETFLAALRAKDGFKGRATEKTWLFAILKHKIIDHYRKGKLTIDARDPADDAEDLASFFNAKGGWQLQPSQWRVDPVRAHQTKEFLDHFYRCLSGLPKRNADAFVYREVDGLSTEEICQRLGITANNCWVMLYRARMLLRKCLELFGFSPQTVGPADCRRQFFTHLTGHRAHHRQPAQQVHLLPGCTYRQPFVQWLKQG